MNVFMDNRTSRNLDDYGLIIEKAVSETLKAENVSQNAEVSVSFVEDTEIQTLNKKYRGIDVPTDVLSFPLLDGPSEITDGTPLGDIVIAFDYASVQAAELGNSVEREICFLTVHGMLHLLGYDHMDERGEEAMTGKQREIMGRIFSV